MVWNPCVYPANCEGMKRRLIIVFLIMVGMAGCDLEADQGINLYADVYDFNNGQQGWEADFTDYPASTQDSLTYELTFSYTNLPSNLGSRKGIMMSGKNYSDDLFMFMKKKVAGLAPNTYYTIVFEVELASNAPTGAVGIGGAPGEGVYLKAGAVSIEPRKVIDGSSYTLNVDKGNQSESGSNLVVLGHIGVAPNTTEYTLITRSNETTTTPFIARTNNLGELWIIVGTDSGFEGTTTVYYTKLGIVFTTSY